MATDDIGGYISTLNKEGVSGTAMGTNDDTGGSISIFNKNSNTIATIRPTEDIHGGIWIYDRYGENPQYYGFKR